MRTMESYFYYPTKVALVDDNRTFLSSTRLKLASTLATALFESPEDALKAINNNPPLPLLDNNVMSALNNPNIDEVSTEKAINIDVKDVYKQIYNPERFSHISTVIVDYDMPNINGIEFCRRIANPGIRKIMVTGKAGYSLAVDAFNEGVINKFIVKSSDNMFDELQEAVKQEQHQYFYNATKSVLDSLKVDAASLLKDPSFLDIFNEIYRKVNACEYYLLDSAGSLLMLDMDANIHLFLVMTEAELERYYQIAKNNDAPKIIIKDLKERRKVLFLHSDDDYKLPVSSWNDHMYTAKKSSGNENFYYALLNAKTNNLISTKGVASYKEYLRGL